MSEMPGCRVEVAWTTPPRTRPADADFTRIDEVTPLRRLKTKRGARIKVAELEAGEATFLCGNGSRDLDPSNTASVWAPNVKLRRRIRAILEPADGSAERKLWTGFIERLPTGWEVGDGWAEVTAVDLLSLIAGDTLPPSVLHQTIIDSAPVAYWPMTETSGRLVDDVVGIHDGELTKPLAGNVEVVPFDRRGLIDFKRPDDNDPAGQRVRIHPIRPTGPSFTLAAWLRQTGDVINNTLFRFAPPSSATDNLSIGMSDPGHLYAVANGVAGDFAQVESSAVANIYDEAPHRVLVTINGTTGAVAFYFDAEPVAVSGSSLHPNFSGVNLTALAAAIDTLELGWGTNFGGSSINASGAVGHAVYWDRVLTAQEVADDYAAGDNPWAGDRTDQRLERILDIIGIDAGDRDIEPGIERCAPATLDGGGVVDYLRKIVSTEPGGAMFVNADGQFAFRPAAANDPTPVATFVGDPDVDAGTPYADVVPDYSLDRVVNVAEVTRENGATQRTTNAASVGEYDPLPVQLSTLHRTASGARSAGARLTNRYREPRLVFNAVEINARSEDVPSADALDRDVSDPVTIIVRPTGGGDPTEQLARIESVEHDLDWRARTWQIDYGLAEHVVLPTLAWDTAGRGWDESVWGP